MNPDLLEERQKCTFDLEEVSQFINIPGLIEFFAKYAKYMRENPEIIFSPDFFEMTREEQMKYYWEMIKK